MLRLWRMLRLVETAVTGRDWSLRIVAFAAKEQKYDGFHAAVRHHCSSSDSLFSLTRGMDQDPTQKSE
jgi:hypothetical protein